MKLIIKLFPEITIKSKSVRLRFIKILTRNISNILNRYDENLSVIRHWDYIEVYVKNKNKLIMILDALVCIPGIHHILEVEDMIFTSLSDISKKVLIRYCDKIINKTFCVRVKRQGKHEFNSIDIERYIGSILNREVRSAKVKLHHPDIIINLEIKNNHILLVKDRYEGIGGFPIGTQGDVLSLSSGGFDSGVSSYMSIRRGCRVHYCFFNIGGITHEMAVRRIAYYLWRRFSSSHHVRFIIINFIPVIIEILEKIDNSQMSVILKRMMIRAATKIATQYDILSLVTGEVLGQVSSQTLTNLNIIDSVSNMLILRPLISYDKEHIVNLARKIGINDFIHNSVEYCSVVSKKPTVKAVRENIEAEELNFNFSILDRVVKEAVNMDISKILIDYKQKITEVEVVADLNSHDIILDIRSADEQNDSPLKVTGVQVIPLPFYKLSTKFSKLDQCKTYLLWCRHGVMSHLQALYLREQGFTNVKVYRHVP